MFNASIYSPASTYSKYLRVYMYVCMCDDGKKRTGIEGMKWKQLLNRLANYKLHIYILLYLTIYII